MANPWDNDEIVGAAKGKQPWDDDEIVSGVGVAAPWENDEIVGAAPPKMVKPVGGDTGSSLDVFGRIGERAFGGGAPTGQPTTFGGVLVRSDVAEAMAVNDRKFAEQDRQVKLQNDLRLQKQSVDEGAGLLNNIQMLKEARPDLYAEGERQANINAMSDQGATPHYYEKSILGHAAREGWIAPTTPQEQKQAQAERLVRKTDQLADTVRIDQLRKLRAVDLDAAFPTPSGNQNVIVSQQGSMVDYFAPEEPAPRIIDVSKLDDQSILDTYNKLPDKHPAKIAIEERVRGLTRPAGLPDPEVPLDLSTGEEAVKALGRGVVAATSPFEALSRLVGQAAVGKGGEIEVAKQLGKPRKEVLDQWRASTDLNTIQRIVVSGVESFPTLVGQVAITAATGGGAAGFTLGAALPVASQSYIDTYDAVVAAGGSHEEAQLSGLAKGLADATITGLTSKVQFNFLAKSEAARKIVEKHLVSRIMGQLLAGGGAEALQEGAEQIGQETTDAIVRAINSMDQVPIEQRLENVFMAGASAFLPGMGTGPSIRQIARQAMIQKHAADLRANPAFAQASYKAASIRGDTATMQFIEEAVGGVPSTDQPVATEPVVEPVAADADVEDTKQQAARESLRRPVGPANQPNQDAMRRMNYRMGSAQYDARQNERGVAEVPAGTEYEGGVVPDQLASPTPIPSNTLQRPLTEEEEYAQYSNAGVGTDFDAPVVPASPLSPQELAVEQRQQQSAEERGREQGRGEPPAEGGTPAVIEPPKPNPAPAVQPVAMTKAEVINRIPKKDRTPKRIKEELDKAGLGDATTAPANPPIVDSVPPKKAKKVIGEAGSAPRDFVLPKSEVTKPMAAKGLISYRYRTATGSHVAIGAKDNADAMREAARSVNSPIAADRLDVWDGEKYVPVQPSPPKADNKPATTVAKPTPSENLSQGTPLQKGDKVLYKGKEAIVAYVPEDAEKSVSIRTPDRTAPFNVSRSKLTKVGGEATQPTPPPVSPSVETPEASPIKTVSGEPTAEWKFSTSKEDRSGFRVVGQKGEGGKVEMVEIRKFGDYFDVAGVSVNTRLNKAEANRVSEAVIRGEKVTNENIDAVAGRKESYSDVLPTTTSAYGGNIHATDSKYAGGTHFAVVRDAASGAAAKSLLSPSPTMAGRMPQDTATTTFNDVVKHTPDAATLSTLVHYPSNDMPQMVAVAKNGKHLSLNARHVKLIENATKFDEVRIGKLAATFYKGGKPVAVLMGLTSDAKPKSLKRVIESASPITPSVKESNATSSSNPQLQPSASKAQDAQEVQGKEEGVRKGVDVKEPWRMTLKEFILNTAADDSSRLQRFAKYVVKKNAFDPKEPYYTRLEEHWMGRAARAIFDGLEVSPEVAQEVVDYIGKYPGFAESYRQFAPDPKAFSKAPIGEQASEAVNAIRAKYPDLKANGVGGQQASPNTERKGVDVVEFGEANDILEVMDRRLARAQRDKPEKAMGVVQRSIGGTGVVPYVAEHLGDLTNRMAQARMQGYDVGNKLRRVLDTLTSRYGFAREHREQIASYAKSKGRPEADVEKEVSLAMQAYADAHRELPVFNEAQRLARDAAVAFGEGNFPVATTKLKALEAMLPNGEVEMRAFLQKGDINFEATAGEATKSLADRTIEEMDRRSKAIEDRAKGNLMAGVPDPRWIIYQGIKYAAKAAKAIGGGLSGVANIARFIKKAINDADLRYKNEQLAMARRNEIFQQAWKMVKRATDADGKVDQKKLWALASDAGQTQVAKEQAVTKAKTEGFKAGRKLAKAAAAKETADKIKKVMARMRAKESERQEYRQQTADMLRELLPDDLPSRRFLNRLVNSTTETRKNQLEQAVIEKIMELRSRQGAARILDRVGGPVKEPKPRGDLRKKVDEQTGVAYDESKPIYDDEGKRVGSTPFRNPVSKADIEPTKMSSKYVTRNAAGDLEESTDLTPRKALERLVDSIRHADDESAAGTKYTGQIEGASALADFLRHQQTIMDRGVVSDAEINEIAALDGKVFYDLHPGEYALLEKAMGYAKKLDEDFTKGRLQAEYKKALDKASAAAEHVVANNKLLTSSDPNKPGERSLLKRAVVDIQADGKTSIEATLGDTGRRILDDLRTAENAGLAEKHKWEAIENEIFTRHSMTPAKRRAMVYDVVSDSDGHPIYLGGKPVTSDMRIWIIGNGMSAPNRMAMLSRGLEHPSHPGNKQQNITLTEEQLERIEDSATPFEQEMAQAMYDWFNGDGKALLNATSQELGGFDVATEPDYWPMKVAIEQAKQGEEGALDELSLFRPDSWLEHLNILKPRKGSALPLKLMGATAAMEQHVRQVTAFNALAKPIREYLTILNNVEFSSASKERLGEGWREAQMRRLKATAGLITEKLSKPGKFLRKLRENWTVARLGFNVASAVVQRTFGITTAMSGRLNKTDAAKLLLKTFTKLRSKQTLRSDPHFKERFGHADRVMMNAYTWERRTPRTAAGTFIEKLVETAMRPMAMSEEAMVEGLYEVMLASSDNPGKTQAEREAWAMKFTEQASRDFNNPSSMLDASDAAIRSREDSLMIPLVAMRGQTQKMANFLFQPLIEGNKREFGKRMGVVSATSIATLYARKGVGLALDAAMAAVGLGPPEDPDKEKEKKKRLIRDAKRIAADFGDLLSPGAGDAISGLVGYLATGKAPQEWRVEIPILSGVEKSLQGLSALAGDIGQATNSDRRDNRYINFRRSMARFAAGIMELVGIPGAWLADKVAQSPQEKTPTYNFKGVGVKKLGVKGLNLGQ